MYHVRLKSKNKKRTVQCSSYTVTNAPENCDGVRQKVIDPGVLVEMDGVPREPRGRLNFRLPEDGDAVFIMNEKGDTLESYRWPPKENR